MPNVTQMGVDTTTGQRVSPPLGSIAPPNSGVDWSRYGIGGDPSILGQFGYGPSADDAAATYRRLFGAITPQSRVQTGMGMGPAVAPGGFIEPGDANRNANGGGANNAPVAPKSTPEEAGHNNSVMPGWSNGQQTVGAPAQYPALPGRTASDPLNTALATMPAAPRPQDTGGAPLLDSNGNPVQTKAAAAGAAGSDASASGSNAAPAPITTQQVKHWTNRISQWFPQMHVKLPSGPVTVDPNANWTSLSGSGSSLSAIMSSISDPTLAVLAGKIWNEVYGNASPIAASLQSGSQSTTPVNPVELQHTLNRVREAEQIFSAYGISFTPLESSGYGQVQGNPVPPPGGTGDGGGTGGGSGTPPGGGGTGPIGGPGTDFAGYPGTNLDISTMSDNAAGAGNIVEGWKNQFGKDPTLIEAAMSMAANATAEANKQKGVNLFGSAYNDYVNDPGQKVAMDTALARLKNPDNTPWDVIRNQTITGSHASADDAASTFGASAARRLGSAGAGAQPGVYADMQRKSGSDLQTALGQLDIQKAAVGREAEQNALNEYGSMFQLYKGGDLNAAHQLAQMIEGAPEVSANPAAGWAQGQYTNTAFQQAQNVSGPPAWQQWVGLAASMLGGSSLSKGSTTGAGGAGGTTTSSSGSGLMALAPLLGLI